MLWPNNVNAVRLLIEHGGSVNLSGGQFGCALQAAVECASDNLIRLLLNSGTNVNQQTHSMQSCRRKPSLNKHRGLVDNYPNALSAAIKRGRVETVRLLLEAGADPTLVGQGELPTAFELALASGNTEMVSMYLLDADINKSLSPLFAELELSVDGFSDDEEWSAIRYAASMSNLDLLRLLLQSGADVNLSSPAGWTSLHEAASRDHYHAVAVLIDEFGARVDVEWQGDLQPLHIAAWCGHNLTVKTLLDRGANPSSSDTNSSRTPIEYAAMRGRHSAVETLIHAFGPNPTARDMEDTVEALELAQEERVKLEKIAPTSFGTSHENSRAFIESPLTGGQRIAFRAPESARDEALQGFDAIINSLINCVEKRRINFESFEN